MTASATVLVAVAISCMLIDWWSVATRRASIEAILDMFQDNRAFLEFFIGEYRPSYDADANALSRKSMDSYRRFLEFFAVRFGAAIEEGEVADFEPTHLAIGLLGNIFTMSSYWIYFDALDMSDAQRHLISDIFFSKIALVD